MIFFDPYDWMLDDYIERQIKKNDDLIKKSMDEHYKLIDHEIKKLVEMRMYLAQIEKNRKDLDDIKKRIEALEKKML